MWLWWILFSKILLFLNLVKFASKTCKIPRIPIMCLFFSLASVVVELSAILWFFPKIKIAKHIWEPCSLLVSISPIFYEQLFWTRVFCAAILCLQFGFVIFWQKDFGAKAAHKMLVKLTPAWQLKMAPDLSSIRKHLVSCEGAH